MTVSPKLGTRHSLEVLKVIRNGLLLDGGELGEVLLPSREVEGQTLAPGDSVMVTLYSDGEGRPMASLRTPRVQAGQVASLKVVSTSKVGAFVDWGMPKDLLLPFAEQKGPVREDGWVLVMMTTDREGRLMVSAQLDRFCPIPAKPTSRAMKSRWWRRTALTWATRWWWMIMPGE